VYPLLTHHGLQALNTNEFTSFKDLLLSDSNLGTEKESNWKVVYFCQFGLWGKGLQHSTHNFVHNWLATNLSAKFDLDNGSLSNTHLKHFI
jgi:hypothetical protein